MALLIDDLQGQISRSPAETFVDVVDAGSLFGQSEVSKQGVPIFIQYNVVWFQIPIDDLLLMKGLQS